MTEAVAEFVAQADPAVETDATVPTHEADAREIAPSVDDTDPTLQQALAFAKKALADGDADVIAQRLVGGGNAADVVAEAAYEIATAAYAETGAAVPEALLILLVASVIQDVMDAAAAAGVDVKLDGVLPALRSRILRQVGEHGREGQPPLQTDAADAAAAEPVATSAETVGA